MLLIGMFDSPFVRRVAITLKLMELPFEHANWSVGKDFDRIREYNPLGRVPTLVTDEGETLMESSAILDYLDERAGAERALLPRSGSERRQALNLMAMATGATCPAGPASPAPESPGVPPLSRSCMLQNGRTHRPPRRQHQTPPPLRH